MEEDLLPDDVVLPEKKKKKKKEMKRKGRGMSQEQIRKGPLSSNPLYDAFSQSHHRSLSK
jgi:hypothetical protein